MSEADARKASERLLDALGAERACVLSGRLEDLADCERERRDCISALEAAGGAPRDAAPDLIEAARRNKALLAAAAEGVRSAIGRLRDLDTARLGTTYGRDGRRRPGAVTSDVRRV